MSAFLGTLKLSVPPAVDLATGYPRAASDRSRLHRRRRKL